MAIKTGYFVCVIPGEHEVDLKLAASVRKQEVRPYSDEGTASADGVYPRRLFAYRHEKAFPYLYSRNLPAILLYLHQCRTARVAAQT